MRLRPSSLSDLLFISLPLLLMAACTDATGPSFGHSPAIEPGLAVSATTNGLYTPIDLGTLGGPSSAAVDMNELGQIVGSSKNASGYDRAFLWENGSMTDLGTLGGPASSATAINNAGQVIGNSWTHSQGGNEAFIWENGSITGLGTLGGGTSREQAINDAGQIVGSSMTAAGRRHAFLWQDGAMTDLGTLEGGGYSHAADINETGQIVGDSEDAAGNNRAVLWEGALVTDLGTLGGANSGAAFVNEAGQVAGWSETADGQQRAFLWQGGVMTDLGTLEETSYAQGLNAVGQVIGQSEEDVFGRTRGFVWNGGVLTEIGTPGFEIETHVESINNAGQVVGYESGNGFVWENGSITDLPTLGGSSGQAVDINEAGYLVGHSRLVTGQTHATLWSPPKEADCVVPPLGLIGWWPGDLDARDIQLNNDGALMYGALAGQPGMVDGAFGFDGVAAHVEVPTYDKLDALAGITLDAWIFVKEYGFYPSIISKGNVGNYDESFALYLTPEGELGFLLNSNGMIDGRTPIEREVIPLETWTFVAGTYDGTTMRTYVNGVEIWLSTAHSGGVNDTPGHGVLIGKAERQSSQTSFFNGLVDEVEVYSRGLTGAEILEIYQADSGGKCKSLSPEEQVDALAESVQELLSAGEISEPGAAELTEKLDAASEKLGSGSPVGAALRLLGGSNGQSTHRDVLGAIKKLEDFIRKAEKLERRGEVSPANAAGLVAAAEAIIFDLAEMY